MTLEGDVHTQLAYLQTRMTSYSEGSPPGAHLNTVVEQLRHWRCTQLRGPHSVAPPGILSKSLPGWYLQNLFSHRQIKFLHLPRGVPVDTTNTTAGHLVTNGSTICRKWLQAEPAPLTPPPRAAAFDPRIKHGGAASLDQSRSQPGRWYLVFYSASQ